jgi:hypothetical protein
MKKRIAAAGAAIVVVLAIAAFAAMRMMAPPDDLDLARSKTSENGLYVVTIAPEAEPVQQGKLHAWVATVQRPDGSPVEDAAIAIDGGMPQHGHGLPTAPQAGGHLGDGRYRIEGMRFNMSGWWELKLTIGSAAGKDSAVYNVVL